MSGPVDSRPEPPGWAGCRVVAHRGACRRAPENTLAAFSAALELGAQAIELDVQRTRDGELVVIHDETVDRTTDGSGPVRELSLAEIRSLDAGSWFRPAFAGERVPTLSEVIRTVRGKACLNVEIKGGPNPGVAPDDDIAGQVLELLRAEDFLGQVLISSFNHEILARVRALDAAVPIAVLYLRHHSHALEVAARVGAQALHPFFASVTPGMVRAAHRRGLRVNPWTVDSPWVGRLLFSFGADAIITNQPSVLALAGRRT